MSNNNTSEKESVQDLQAAALIAVAKLTGALFDANLSTAAKKTLDLHEALYNVGLTLNQ